MGRISDDAGRGVAGEVEVRVAPVDGFVVRIDDLVFQNRFRAQLEDDGSREAVGVTARYGRIRQPAPDVVIRVIRQKRCRASIERVVESVDGPPKVVAATAAPDDDLSESLLGQ